MGRKVRPGRFQDLEIFAEYCRVCVEKDGPDATVLINWSGPAPRSGRREIAPGGLYARHLGLSPTRPGWQLYEVGAQAFAEAAEQGRLVEWGRAPV